MRDCGLPPTLVLTDQHVNLSPAEFGLELYPAVHLGCGGEEDPDRHIDDRAELLFAPTKTAVENLRAEGVRGKVHLTGNIGIDALKAAEKQLTGQSLVIERLPRILVTCHRRESWGEGLKSIAAALIQIARDGRATIDVVLIPTSMSQPPCGSYSIQSAGFH